MTSSALPSWDRDELRLHRLLFPEEAERVVAGEQVSARVRAEAELDAAADALLGEGGALHTMGLAMLDAHPDGARATELFAAAFADARALWPALTVPTPEDFTEAGAQFVTLADALSQDDTLTPVLAPHGLGPEEWEAVFARTAEAPTLVLSADVRDAFVLLDRVLDRAAHPVFGEGGEVVWTLALIPAGDAPQVLGLNHARGPHPSIAEMLTLQLRRVLAGEAPVDGHSFTWIDGRFGDDKLAARHVFDGAEGSVRVSSRSAAQQGPHQGARPPARG